jgi:hypothetical protein
MESNKKFLEIKINAWVNIFDIQAQKILHFHE